MAMPISNTHLRVPRGFGALLEGLTREILRDQPKDIPKYATEYFETLLKQREEKGTDPSEWAAKLEDRYHNNHSFKTSNDASRTTVSNKNTEDSVAEDCSGQSEEDVSMITMKTKHLTTSDEEKSSPVLTQAESAKGPPTASPDTTASTKADRLSNEINNSTASNQNNSESEEREVKLFGETENTDTQESDAGGEDDQEQTDREDEAGNANICATYLEDETADVASVTEEDAEQKVASDSSEIRPQSPVSQMEMTEQEQACNDANGWTTSDDIKECDKSLVEISFEDVPENLQNMNNELRINKEIMEKTATITNEQEVQSEEKRLDDDNEENISNHDNSMEESVDTIDSEHQSTKKADNLVDEDTNNINNDVNSSLDDNFEKHHLTEDATTITEEGETEDYQEIEHQKSVDEDPASDLTQLTDSKVKILEGQCEIIEKGEDDLSGEEEQYQEETLEKYFTLSQDQHSEEEELVEEGLSDSEDKEGLSSHDQDNVNPDREEWPDKEDTGQQEEQRDTPDPEGQTNDKQEECSRPQEEEDIMDIPLDDPEANRAAAKIQAGFRGHMTRKKMKPEDKAEGEEVSSSGDVLNSRQGGTETGGSRPVGSDDTSVPEQ